MARSLGGVGGRFAEDEADDRDVRIDRLVGEYRGDRPAGLRLRDIPEILVCELVEDRPRQLRHQAGVTAAGLLA